MNTVMVYNCVQQIYVPLRRWMRWCWDYNTSELHYTEEDWEGIPQ